MRLCFILVIFLISLVSAYRFVRKAPETYRIQVGPHDYRIAEPSGAYRYRVARSAEDGDDSPPYAGNDVPNENDGPLNAEAPKPKLSAIRAQSYRYRIFNSAIVGPKSEAAGTPGKDNCKDGQPNAFLNCAATFLLSQGIPLTNQKLPNATWVEQQFFNKDKYDNEKGQYQTFTKCLSDNKVSDFCFYASSLKPMVSVVNDEYQYTTFFTVLYYYFKDDNSRQALECDARHKLGCEAFDLSCPTMEALLNCTLFVYDQDGCSGDFRQDLCNFFVTDLNRDELLEDSCHSTLNNTCANLPKTKPDDNGALSSSILTLMFTVISLNFGAFATTIF